MRSWYWLALGAALTLGGAVSAQDGPPKHIREAVGGFMEMLGGDDDASIRRFLSRHAKPEWVAGQGDATLIRELGSLRDAAAGLAGEVDVRGAEGGVQIQLSDGSDSLVIALDIEQGGITGVRVVRPEAPSAVPATPGQAVEAHARMLERAHLIPMAERVAFIAEHHLDPELVSALGEDRLHELVDELAAAAAQAGGAVLRGEDGQTILELEGPERFAVTFEVAERAPFRITELGIEPLESGLQLDWANLEDALDALALDGLSGALQFEYDGERRLRKAYGMANPGLGIKNGMDTIFGIGSTPIDFTIAAAFLLAQRAVVDLDAAIGNYLSDVPEDKQSMTLRHIIDGRSGLPDFFHRADDWDADLAWVDRDGAIARLMAQPLRFEPGTDRAHSHGAYVLLAAIVEIVSGTGYYEFIRENLLVPAGMTRTGMYGMAMGYQLEDFAVGNGASSVGLPNIPPNWGPTSWLILGSGGMYSTLDDMWRFFDLVTGDDLLSDEHAAHFRRGGFFLGGSDRGFEYLHAETSRGRAMALLNMDGRSAPVRNLTRAIFDLMGAGR